MIEVTRPEDKYCSCQSCGSMKSLLKVAVFKSTASINVTYLCRSCLAALGEAAEYLKSTNNVKYQYESLRIEDNN